MKGKIVRRVTAILVLISLTVILLPMNALALENNVFVEEDNSSDQTVGTSEDAQNVEEVQGIDEDPGSEETQSTEALESTEGVQSTDAIENTEDIQSAKDIQNIEYAELKMTKGPSMRALPISPTRQDLQDEIDLLISIAPGTPIRILIPNNILFDGTAVTIPAGEDITLESDIGGSYILTQGNSAVRHFIVEGKLTLQDIILDGSTSQSMATATGGGIDVKPHGAIVLESGCVLRYISTSAAGAIKLVGATVAVTDHSYFTMEQGALITECKGGAVNLEANAIGEMNGGIISDINSQNNYAAVRVYGSKFTLNSGEIRDNINQYATGNNSEAQGGGIYGTEAIVNTFNGIIGNSVYFQADIEINGGKITGNTSNAGGGVCLRGVGRFSMTDGLISNNIAVPKNNNVDGFGGGIHMSVDTYDLSVISDISISGGKITNNKAQSGGGIFHTSRPQTRCLPLSITGGEISYNSATSPTDGPGGGIFSVYADLILGDTSGGRPLIRGNSALQSMGGGVCFFLGKLVINDAEIAENVARNGGGVMNLLEVEMEMHDGIIRDNIAFDDGAANAPGRGGGLFVDQNSKATIYGGEFSGNTAERHGGGIYVIDAASALTTPANLIMLGGTIKDNGDTVYNTILGRTVNATRSGGGLSCAGNSVVEIKNGTIEGNYASNTGGGIAIAPYSAGTIYQGKLIIKGNTITGDHPIIQNNESGFNGGGISSNAIIINGTPTVKHVSVLEIEEASILGNVAAKDGGGIYISDETYSATYLKVDTSVMFNSNTAVIESSTPLSATTTYPNIQFGSRSTGTHVLNNYDINAYYNIIEYKNNGGSGTGPATEAHPQGISFQTANNTFTPPSGAQFKEWNTQANGLGTSYAENVAVTMSNQDITLYAIWLNGSSGGSSGSSGNTSTKPAIYTITYTDGVNGQTIFADQKYDAEEGTATPVFKGTPSRKGYEFDGWNPEVAPKVTGDAVYKATWKKIEGYYTVTYTDGIKNEFVFADQVYVVEEGSKTPTFKGTISRNGYKFTGWDPEIAQTVTDDVVYTAIWEKIKKETSPPTKPNSEPSNGSGDKPTKGIGRKPVIGPNTGDKNNLLFAWVGLAITTSMVVMVWASKHKKEEEC